MNTRWVDWLFGIAIAILAVMVAIGIWGDSRDGKLLAVVPPTVAQPQPAQVVATAAPPATATPLPGDTATASPPTVTQLPTSAPTATSEPSMPLLSGTAPTWTPAPAPPPADIPYTADVGGEVQIIQSKASADFLGDFEVVGEVRNTSQEPIDFLFLTITLYDRNGGILATRMTTADVSPLSPGQTTSFSTFSTVPYSDVGSYRIQRSN